MRVDGRGAPAFSVQYHPEAGPGPHDARYLFAMFDEMMGPRPGLPGTGAAVASGAEPIGLPAPERGVA